MTIGLPHYLAVAAVLFTIGVFGIFLNRKNVIVILMSIELILLAVNINFVAFSAYLGDLVGQVFALFVLTVAAAEAAIGLAILVVYFRNRRHDRGRRRQPDERLTADVFGDRLPARRWARSLPACSAAIIGHRAAELVTTVLLFVSAALGCFAFYDVAILGHAQHRAISRPGSPPAISPSTGPCASTR